MGSNNHDPLNDVKSSNEVRKEAEVLYGLIH
eukprot:CAMPEP_0170559894 /NCGR_PEP_ID=MMETSP0211-20121228/45749_1 /TAXON_ID=311385 /ORGANISM="Pseudokeronopsis sp., Strain OXSARD2" /LENGTH=30 /DNA_ID= /DNA_START= /DNA_END= /DNA_ORIENTATION=